MINECDKIKYIDEPSSGGNSVDADDVLIREIEEAIEKGKPKHESSSSSSSHRTTTFYVSANHDSADTSTRTISNKAIDSSEDKIDAQVNPDSMILKLGLDECGFPLQLFHCGSYFHPYLSLSYLDVISDVRFRSCLIGATNVLFSQKRNLFDVIIDVSCNFKFYHKKVTFYF